MEQPKYEPGQRVMAMDDDGIYREAWIGDVVATYEYTIRRPPNRFYDGRTIPGVLVSEERIKEISRG